MRSRETNTNGQCVQQGNPLAGLRCATRSRFLLTHVLAVHIRMKSEHHGLTTLSRQGTASVKTPSCMTWTTMAMATTPSMETGEAQFTRCPAPCRAKGASALHSSPPMAATNRALFTLRSFFGIRLSSPIQSMAPLQYTQRQPFATIRHASITGHRGRVRRQSCASRQHLLLRWRPTRTKNLRRTGGTT